LLGQIVDNSALDVKTAPLRINGGNLGQIIDNPALAVKTAPLRMNGGIWENIEKTYLMRI
jgi:hypothetical protein